MACLQDSNGHFISSLSSCFTGILSPLEAEARAHNVALHWLSSRDQRHVIIETDCKQILDIMKARNFQNNEFLSPILEFRRGMRGTASSWLAIGRKLTEGEDARQG
ncbi:hypothetical protein JHK86_012627 [Glycine max]|nr:hypothetical protein JHK86_012627 [Glycine max]